MAERKSISLITPYGSVDLELPKNKNIIYFYVKYSNGLKEEYELNLNDMKLTLTNGEIE
jgi:hypothetical protein